MRRAAKVASRSPLNKKIIERTQFLLSKGVFPKAALESQGFTVQNYHRWRKKGAEELERRQNGEKAVRANKVYVDFFLATEIANAEVEIEATQNIRAIAKDKKVDPRIRLEAEKFFLMARFKHWQPTNRLEVEGEVKYNVVIPAPARIAQPEDDEGDFIDAEFEEMKALPPGEK